MLFKVIVSNLEEDNHAQTWTNGVHLAPSLSSACSGMFSLTVRILYWLEGDLPILFVDSIVYSVFNISHCEWKWSLG